MVWTHTEERYIGRRMMKFELPGRRPTGRPKRGFMDIVKEDMKLAEEDAEDGVRWRRMACCGIFEHYVLHSILAFCCIFMFPSNCLYAQTWM